MAIEYPPPSLVHAEGITCFTTWNDVGILEWNITVLQTSVCAGSVLTVNHGPGIRMIFQIFIFQFFSLVKTLSPPALVHENTTSFLVRIVVGVQLRLF